MKVVIQDRTQEVGVRLRSYAERRLEKLSRHFERVLEAEVHFDPESKRAGEAEIGVSILVRMDGRKKPVLKAQETGRDAQSALDLALDKVDRRVLKLKDRIVDRHHGHRGDGDEEAAAPVTVTAGPERVTQRVKAESLDQAIDALESNGHHFHVFLDEDDGELNIVYRRADGTVAILEPKIS